MKKGFATDPMNVAAGESSRPFSGKDMTAGYVPDNAFTPVDTFPADYGTYGATGTAPPGGTARRGEFSGMDPMSMPIAAIISRR